MLFLASTLRNLKVLERNGLVLATVVELVFDPENLKLAGILVKKDFFQQLFGGSYIISPVDILTVTSKGIIVKDASSILKVSELVRAERILKSQQKIIGLQAEDAKGKNLGKVIDLLFDDVSGRITKFYLHSIINDMILPAERLVKITKKKAIFDIEELEKEKSAVMAPVVE